MPDSSRTESETETRSALRLLVDEYSVAGDTFDGERYAALFTEDASFTAQIGDNVFLSLQGREEIAKAPQANGPFEQTFHQVGNQVVEIDGACARGIVYGLARHLLRKEDGSLESVVTPLHYRDNYVRTESGWRIAKRATHILWYERVPVDSNGLESWT